MGRFLDRHNSNTRSAATQNISDIMIALKKLDESREIPKFAALQYDRIPKMEPEDCNIAFIAQRMTKMETTIGIFESLLAVLRIDLLQVEGEKKNM